MFTTAKQAAHSASNAAKRQATALGLAAVVTLSMLASVNGLATAPAPDSLLAAGNAQIGLVTAVKVAANI